MSLLAAILVLAILCALACMALRLRLGATRRPGRAFDWAAVVLAAGAILGYGAIARDCRASGACAPNIVHAELGAGEPLADGQLR